MQKITGVGAIALFLFVTSLMHAQNEPAPKESAIPFELKGHIILVKGKINQQPEEYNFMVDTGAKTILDDALAQKLQLKRRGMMVKMNSLELGAMRIDSVFCVVSADFFKSFESGVGLTIHGLIGSDLLEDYKVTIDYRLKQLVLATDTASTGSAPNGFLCTFKKHPVNSAPMIACKINGTLEVQAMVDTGQPYPIVLPLDLLNTLKLTENKGWIKANGNFARWPMTSNSDNYLGRVDTLTMANLSAQNVLTLGSELPSLLSSPLLGRDFLLPYITVINYPKNEILFIPQSTPTAAPPVNDSSFGVSLHLDEAGKVVVRGVWPGSAADKAGISPGDEVLTLNGAAISRQNLFIAISQLRDPAVQEVKVEIKNARGKRVSQLKKGLLLPELKK